MIFLIYKVISDPYTGEIDRMEIIDTETNEDEIKGLVRLYTLQIPVDLKNFIQIKFVAVRVV